MSDQQSYDVVLEADFTDPALAPAAFQVLRQAGMMHDLPNVGWVRIHMSVELDGYAHEWQIQNLRDHLEAIWFGGVREVKVRPKRQPEE